MFATFSHFPLSFVLVECKFWVEFVFFFVILIFSKPLDMRGCSSVCLAIADEHLGQGRKLSQLRVESACGLVLFTLVGCACPVRHHTVLLADFHGLCLVYGQVSRRRRTMGLALRWRVLLNWDLATHGGDLNSSRLLASACPAPAVTAISGGSQGVKYFYLPFSPVLFQ